MTVREVGEGSRIGQRKKLNRPDDSFGQFHESFLGVEAYAEELS